MSKENQSERDSGTSLTEELSDEQMDQALKRIKVGVPADMALLSVRSTLTIAQLRSEPYAGQEYLQDFLQEVQFAEAECQASLIAAMRKQANSSPAVAQRMLEMQNPQQFRKD